MTSHERDPLPERLRSAIDGLAREIEPRRDAWPAIRSRIDAERVVPLHTDGRPPCRAARRWPVAAAAVLVIAASTVTMLASNRQRRPTADGAAFNTAVGVGAGAARVASDRRQLVADVCNSYDAAADDLQRVLVARRARLSPKTVQVLESSLRAIDQAIREARAALEVDPASQDLMDLLDSVYRQKLDLLRRANALPLHSS
ncbi:MAG: hypothetical protein HYV19_10655 [Gemmatimonadetes bacterium]|nr:hypothetical protein [Gemmatimonadota bacterium]